MTAPGHTPDRVEGLAAALDRHAHTLESEARRLLATDRTPAAYWDALFDRERARRDLAAVAPSHPTLQRENRADAHALVAARRQLLADRADRIRRRPMTPDGWAALARTPA